MSDSKTPNTPGRAWQISADRRLHWRCWQDEAVVYNDTSGDTHLLDPLSAEVLSLLDQTDQSIRCEDIARQIAAAMNMDEQSADIDFLGRVEGVIDNFYRLELIVPAR